MVQLRAYLKNILRKKYEGFNSHAVFSSNLVIILYKYYPLRKFGYLDVVVLKLLKEPEFTLHVSEDETEIYDNERFNGSNSD